MPQTLIESLGQRLFAACEEAGNMVVLFVESLRECSRVAEHPHRIFIQMKNIGNDTLFIASAISLFIGMTLALYSGHALRQFSYTEALPSLVANSIVKEMAPVITALLLAGRIGAAIAAELGTMRVNEEIDALYTLGISPIRYLAMPRFVGCITMLPVLVDLREPGRDVRRRAHRLGVLQHDLGECISRPPSSPWTCRTLAKA